MEPSCSNSAPLVSCVLPTKNRARFIPQAIRCYQAQTYPHKELLIIDNGLDGTEALIPRDDPSIRYYRITGSHVTGYMRNVCGHYAQGEILCHFDSDDWSAPERVADQVARLGVTGVVTGYHAMLFYDERDGRCYHWQTHTVPIAYVLGTSLCYRREWWQRHRFQTVLIGEDVLFFRKAHKEARQRTSSVPAGELMVARVHHQQTSRKSLSRNTYTPVTLEWLPEAFRCGLTSSVT